jgi:hypothetical protein
MVSEKKLSPAVMLVVSCAFLTSLTCTRLSELYNPTDSGSSCYAFVCDTAVSAVSQISDTVHFRTRDTIHTADSITLVGVIYPLSDKIVRSYWTLSDGTTGSQNIFRKKFSRGGVYQAVFTIEDSAGLTMNDLVVVHVNTPPPAPTLLSPVSGAVKINPNFTITLRWSCHDPDTDQLSYCLLFNNTTALGRPPFLLDNITDTFFAIPSGELDSLTRYYWMVKAIDKYNDTAASDTFSFITKNPNATSGILQGVAVFQGKQDHAGIIIGIHAAATTWQYDTTDAQGNYQFNTDPKTYTIIAIDDVRKEYFGDTTTGTVTAGEVTVADTLVLTDPYKPVITLVQPTDTQTVRLPVIHITYYDTGSGVLPSSARLLFNDSNVTAEAVISQTGLTWTPGLRLANGLYRMQFDLRDSVGNAAQTATWSFTVDAFKVSAIHDTVIDHGGSVRCSVHVQDNFGPVLVEIDTANSGTYVTVLDNDTSAAYTFSTGNACSWDSVKIRITDADSTVITRAFDVAIRPRTLSITTIDSTDTTITVNYSPTQETDFAEYRLYRNTTNTVDTNCELWKAIVAGGTVSYSTPTPGFTWEPSYYRVYQVDNEGLWSTGSSVVYGCIVNTPPTAPTIAFPKNNGDSIGVDTRIKWTRCTDVNGQDVKYRVMIDHNSTGYVEYATEVTDTVIDWRGYDSLGMKIRVIAYDNGGDSTWSVERTAFNKFSVGQRYGGGIIFYVDNTTVHGLIAAPVDQGIAWWGDTGTSITGATGTAIGTGQANTTAILASSGSDSIAARLCDHYENEGFTDWYLPSKDELDSLYSHRFAVGNLVQGGPMPRYWSSSEADANNALALWFNGGGWMPNPPKNMPMILVRAIRSF